MLSKSASVAERTITALTPNVLAQGREAGLPAERLYGAAG